MTNFKQLNSSPANKILTIASIIFSGSCWYFGNGLNGNQWWLLWLAPVPILIISLNTSGKFSFLVAFVSYLIGRLSWLSYLVAVATWIPALIFTLILPFFFAVIITITRKIALKNNSLISVFAFPVFFTTFEFLFCSLSKDGTAGSIAYSQMNFLPLVQVSSITGLTGITFFVTLVPSLIAFSWYYRNEKSRLRSILIATTVIIAPVLLFGIFRSRDQPGKNTITVGLVSAEESIHDMSNQPDPGKSIQVAENYAGEIKKLAVKGIKFIVLPERAININDQINSKILQILGEAAKQNSVTIVTGYTNFKNGKTQNSALVIDSTGNVINDYNKVHLVTGFENQFTPGNTIGLFESNGIRAGVAICKDLDFSNYIKKYGKQKVDILFIPAWDFVTDDWLHARMAILRGVENGFSEIRTARQGRLTISDPKGRINAEATSSKGNPAVLVGQVTNNRVNTIYTRYGDWFGYANLFVFFYFLFIALKKQRDKFTNKS